jgi:D-arginine dehydrogenase
MQRAPDRHSETYRPASDDPVDCLIVGGGIAGLSTAWSLGQRGAGPGVLLLEREAALAQHSSRLNAAILRTLTGEPASDTLALEGAQFLRAPPADFAASTLVDETGLLLLASGARARELAAQAANVPRSLWRELDPRALTELAPHWLGRAELALLFERDGRIELAALLAAYERGARAAGVRVRCGAHVRELWVEDGRVRGAVLASGERITARRTVLAAGAWAGQLAARAGSPLRLRPTRRHLLLARGAEPAPARALGAWSAAESFYARAHGPHWLCCALDETEVDPDACCVDPRERARIEARARALLAPARTLEPLAYWCGMRTFSPDGQFLVGPDARLAGLFWVGALGGHGITCAPAIGRIAAELLLERAPRDAAQAGLRAALDPRRTIPERVG